MKILALDTSTKSCSAAVTDDGLLCAELTILKNQTHSRHLMESVHAVLKVAGTGTAELDGFAVTIGPGSFTGLRIGISTIKGLAYALGKPVVGISSLEALACQCTQTSHLICPLLDARKGEVYCAAYSFGGGRLIQRTGACVKDPDDFLKDIKTSSLFIGSGAQLYRSSIEAALGSLAHFVPEEQNLIRASSVAFLSRSRFLANRVDEAAALVPYYIRKSDAELNAGR